MKKFINTFLSYNYLINIFICIFILCISINRLDAQYKAFYIPEKLLNDIKIERILDECNIDLDEFKITTEMVFSGVKPDTNDCTVTILVGWSDITNWIYIFVEVIDDFVFFNENLALSLNDCVEIVLNPALSDSEIEYLFGIPYLRIFPYLSHSLMHLTLIPVDSEKKNVNINLGPKWITDKQYLKSYTTVKKYNNKFKISYMLGISLWDYWFLYDKDLSDRHFIQEGQNIGLTLKISDVDKVMTYDAHLLKTMDNQSYITTTNFWWWNDGSAGSTFYLKR